MFIFAMRCKKVLLRSICLFILCLANSATAENNLIARWLIDEKQSDSAEVMLKKKFRRLKPGQTRPYSMRDPTGTTADGALANYWRTLHDGKERRASKNLRRVGSAYPLVTFTDLQIDAIPESEGLIFNYEKSLLRTIMPNINGRIYTANGNELISDSIGHTLSYWSDSSLFLETDSPSGGRYIEELKLSADKTLLYYQVKLDLPILKEPVVIKRVLRKAN